MPVKILQQGEVRVVLERLKLDDRHTITNPDGSPPPMRNGDYLVEALGGGAFGVVVRVSDLLGMPRAAKILTDGVGASEPEVGTNLFLREIELTNGRPYKHIVPIIFYDTVRAGGGGYNYYVSQFVPGFTLRRFSELIKNHRDEFCGTHQLRMSLHDWMLGCVGDILSGVVELQAGSIAHMDIKPDNTLLHPHLPPRTPDGYADDDIVDLVRTSGMDAFLIDLGAGKPVVGTGRTQLRCTPYFFPPILDKLYFFGGKIAYEELGNCWRVIDLYSVGRTLELVMLDRHRRWPDGFTVANGRRIRIEDESQIANEQDKEEFWTSIFGPQMEVIEGLIDRLLMVDGGGFDTAADARFAFATIPLASTRNVYDSDILINRSPADSIALGLSTSTTLAEQFQKIVDHPAFQRLRGIQQLSYVSEIYPDATHTRFTHSLRCYETTKRALMSLSRHSAFRLLFDRRYIDKILAAALLHDVGQYHFAHSIEDLKKLGDLAKDDPLSDIKHDQERIEAVCQVPDEHGVTIKTLLADCGIAFDDVRYITSKRAKDSSDPRLNIARDLISGMIDMDRVSYLIHDSERTGVPYGMLNVAALLDALTLKYDRYSALGDVGIGIDEKGVTPAVTVLIAIYLMYREVYWHQDNRAFMAAVKTCMLRLLRRGKLSFDGYLTATSGGTDAAALAFIESEYRLLMGVDDQVGRNPLTDLVELRGLGYVSVCAVHYEEKASSHLPIAKEAERLKRSRELYARMVRETTPERLDILTQQLAEQLRLRSSKHVVDGDVLIDIPMKRRLGTGTVTEETLEEIGASPKLWVRFRSPFAEDVEWRELRQCSVVVQALEQSEELDSRPVRVFVSRHAIDALGATGCRRLNGWIFDALCELTEIWPKGATERVVTEATDPAGGLAPGGGGLPVN